MKKKVFILIFKMYLQIKPTKGQPWPLPQQFAAESTFFTIQPDSFKFLHSSKCDVITEAVKRYQKLLFLDHCVQSSFTKSSEPPKYDFPGSSGQLYNLTIEIFGKCEKYPYMNMDEQCKHFFII